MRFLLAISFAIFCGVCVAMSPPVIPRSAIAPAYLQATGKELPAGLLGVIDDENNEKRDNGKFRDVGLSGRTAPNGQPSDLEMQEIALNLCGRNRPPVEPVEVRDRWSHIWWETRAPSTFVLDILAPNPDGNNPSGVLILRGVGEFNSSLMCTNKIGCGLLNRRKQDFVGVPNSTSFNSAFFLLSEERGNFPLQEMCGFDAAISQSGTFGNVVPPGNSGYADDSYIYPIFYNVRNRAAPITVDTFGGAGREAGVLADAGYGTNAYDFNIIANETSGERFASLRIDSTFYINDPGTGSLILYGFQTTKYQVPLPPSLI